MTDRLDAEIPAFHTVAGIVRGVVRVLFLAGVVIAVAVLAGVLPASGWTLAVAVVVCLVLAVFAGWSWYRHLDLPRVPDPHEGRGS